MYNFKNSGLSFLSMTTFKTNKVIAAMFFEMADILEIQEVKWKPIAYRNAARTIENLNEDLKAIYKRGGIKALEDIPGVGEGLAKKIIQYIEIGHVKEYEYLTKSIPPGLKAIIDVPSMGPKKAYVLYKKLNIRSLADLKKAIKAHKVQKLFGFGAVSEEKIQESLGMQKAHKERRPLKDVLPVANKIISELKKLKEVEMIEAVGSLRRKEATIGDIDILAVSKNPALVMNKFTTLPQVDKIVAKGSKKSVVILRNGMQSDLRVFDKKSFGAAMQYFTGNKLHNIELRKIAIKKGYKLNEYGLFDKKGKMIAGTNEEGIYNKLGLKYIPPEKRRNQGEIEAARL